MVLHYSRSTRRRYYIEEQEALHDVHCLKWKMKRRSRLKRQLCASTFVEPSFPLQEKVILKKVKLKLKLEQGPFLHLVGSREYMRKI
ncbi:hypothetical protein Patl1_35335 [Pistacia atlantica]|nr:hypothetical protein Patl1_35335 [Pistacia atlantica]